MPVRFKKSNTRVTMARKVVKADTQVAVDQPMEYEDDFSSLYRANTDTALIEPTFNPLTLKGLVVRNNILLQCIHAMEVNVDGTGHTIELIEGKTETEKEKKDLEDFFKEPYPGMSMVALRRKVRNDEESIGWGFWEVMRSGEDKLKCLRYMNATTMRMVKLGEPVMREETIVREGKEEKISILVRERRYAQVVGTKIVYYKDYGSSRDLDKVTGLWAKKGEKLPHGKRASEVMMFGVEPDVMTPYFVPRWLNNLPSVLGSRKAEEYNLEFFDSGGLPPALIFLLGGGLADPVRTQLLHFLSGSAKDKHRAALVEAHSTSGSIEGGGAGVNVKVERFGDTRMNDSMFQKYDENTENHVRVSFRIPPIFFGKAADYNFATAMTAILVTEAQVFQPERHEFDERINKTIMKEFGAVNYEFKSKPMTIRNADLQMTGIEAIADKVSGEDLVNAINDITNLNLKFDQATADEHNPMKIKEKELEAQAEQVKQQGSLPGVQERGGPVRPGAGTGQPMQGGGGRPRGAALRVVKEESMEPADVMSLAEAWCESIGIIKSEDVYSRNDVMLLSKYILTLSESQKQLFDRVVAMKQFGSTIMDTEGMSEIAGVCSHIMARDVVSKMDVPVVIQKEETQPREIKIVVPGLEEMANALSSTANATERAVRTMVLKEDKPVNLNLQVDLKLPERKPVEKQITFSDGRQVLVSDQQK